MKSVREEVESIRGGGVGGAPPPRTGCSSGNVPHSVPLCNTNVVLRPTNLEPCPRADLFSLQNTGSCGRWGAEPARVACAGRRADGAAAPRIAVRWGRPQGDQRDDVLDAAGKVLRTDDPEAKIRALIDEALKEAENPGTSYEKDIEPWLGEKAGVWVTGVYGDKPGYVALIAAKDTDKAQEAIDKGIKD